MCVRRGETETETQREREREGGCQFKRGRERLKENDRRGRRKGKECLRKTTPERLCAEPTAPSQPSSSFSSLHPSFPPSLPVCFAMVTRQGSQCSQLMCFSAAGPSWVLMWLSLSPAQSMSTVLGCTNTWRAESQGTLSHPGWASGPESEKKKTHVTFIYSPENCSCVGLLSGQRERKKKRQWRSLICAPGWSQISHVDLCCNEPKHSCHIQLREQKCCKSRWKKRDDYILFCF